MQLTSVQKHLQQQIEHAINHGKLNDAHLLLISNIKNTPDDHFSYFLLAQVNVAANDISKAHKLLNKAISIDPMPLYFAHSAKLAVLSGNLLYAQQAINKAVEYTQFNAIECDLIANVLTRLGYYQHALEWQLRAYQHAPENPQICYNLAVAYKIMGQLNDAIQLLRTLTELHPQHFQAHYSLAELNNNKQAKQHLQQLLTLTEYAKTPMQQQFLHHAIALNYEHCADYKQAFAHFTTSKQAICQHVKYDAQAHKAFSQQLITLSHSYTPSLSDNDFTPIFIVGMPRSGTTLLEKIMNQSDLVQGVGELNDIAQVCQGNNAQALNSVVLNDAYKNAALMAQLSQYKQRISQLVAAQLRSCDKQPFNFYYIDLILAAFPKAKIICMQRGRKASCIANYRQLYSPASAFHHYSYNLQDIDSFYQDYSSLINHFAAKHPDNVMIMQYETLVSEPITSTQLLYDFCDLPWQVKCLDFHKQHSPSATASKVQVRQPLNNKAIDYWQHYGFAFNAKDKDLFR
ncbi:tetratricopeptide repeat-containing sulfotransferase family protein [Pseudoalteromonas ostreae]|uniref:tetratricopeptide repeat-containing sulfotransferase family protein n=1 Tax=Pseudoalteromonas ostreae TaxID=2774154 RepID=UPI001E2EF2BF|nr:sulfotransferase [Pseudoalteromonas ostreae]